MEIDPLNRVAMNAPFNSISVSTGSQQPDPQVVAAVLGLNKSEMLGEDRALLYRREPKTGRMVIQLVEKQTGDVVDQIPPESVLLLYSRIQEELKVKGEE